ncbi:MAG TPA: helicase C-terminal domain-containing protein, partial [Saprospiraceae bacterium]|nr:helicase C-terminal domain-containing protein [Saprospiraceae bacterium]
SISIQLEQSGQLIELEPFEWEIVRYSPSSGKTQEWLPEVIGRYSQYPLKLAWAITIHKSQGQTFEKVHIDLGRGAFEHGQVYVALSRSKTLEGITLGQPIGWKDIRTDPRVIDFMSRYR